MNHNVDRLQPQFDYRVNYYRHHRMLVRRRDMLMVHSNVINVYRLQIVVTNLLTYESTM